MHEVLAAYTTDGSCGKLPPTHGRITAGEPGATKHPSSSTVVQPGLHQRRQSSLSTLLALMSLYQKMTTIRQRRKCLMARMRGAISGEGHLQRVLLPRMTAWAT